MNLNMWVHRQVEEEPNAFSKALENGDGSSMKMKNNTSRFAGSGHLSMFQGPC